MLKIAVIWFPEVASCELSLLVRSEQHLRPTKLTLFLQNESTFTFTRMLDRDFDKVFVFQALEKQHC